MNMHLKSGADYKNEGDVKAEVKKLLTAHKWRWWMPAASSYGARTVDFEALRAGVFMVDETKFGRRQLTTNQNKFLRGVQLEGGYAFIVREHTVVLFAAWLDAFDRAMDRVRTGEPESKEDSALMVNAIREMTKEIL